jgi:hypothetical protein
MAKLTAKQRKAMPASSFAGGKKKGTTGRFPIQDKAHVQAAKRFERFATPAEKSKIDAAAKRMGVGTKKASSKKGK